MPSICEADIKSNMEKYCPVCKNNYPASLSECPEDGTALVSLVQRDLTGEVLDKRYEVLEQVGAGGMGVVYKARQRMIKRVVALKVLRPEVTSSESSVQRFLNEATAIASLKSPHTVTLYDFGVTRDGQLYYTMELLSGRPLSHIIRKDGALDYRRAVELVRQSCDSLEEAHDHGILHRDIKPDNIFVTEERGRETAKVLDFGIAKLVNEDEGNSLTQTGMICGTPQYLSPEQVHGEKACPASDLYSLGVVLYELLTGTPPFTATTPMKVMLKHLQEEIESMTVRNPRVRIPESLNLFVQRALEKKPADRFASVSEFRTALLKAVEDHRAAPRTITATAMTVASSGVRSLADIEPDDTIPVQAVVADADAGPAVGISSLGPTAVQQTVGPENVDPFQPTMEQGVMETAEARSVQPTEELVGMREDPPAPAPATERKTSGATGIVISVVMTLLLVAVGLLIWRPWDSTTPATEDPAPVPAAATAPENMADVLPEAVSPKPVDVPLAKVEVLPDEPAMRTDVSPEFSEIEQLDLHAAELEASDQKARQEIGSPAPDLRADTAEVAKPAVEPSTSGPASVDKGKKTEHQKRRDKKDRRRDSTGKKKKSDSVEKGKQVKSDAPDKAPEAGTVTGAEDLLEIEKLPDKSPVEDEFGLEKLPEK